MAKPLRLGIDSDIYDALKIATLGAIVQSEAAGGGGLAFGDGILLYDSGGAAVVAYPATENGLISALAAASAGDTIWLPSVEIALTAGIVLVPSIALIGIDEYAILSFSGFSGTALTMAANAVVSGFTVLYESNGTTAIGIDARFPGCVVDCPVVLVWGGSTDNVGVWAGSPET